MSTWSTALSHSASANTMCGFLPPSSTATLVTCSAATLAMVRPVASPPVNEMKSTSGVSVSAAPSVAPLPCTRFTTDGRNAGLFEQCTNAIVRQRGDLAGFGHHRAARASAGAIFQDICSSG